jgi:hypothetical protein
MFKDVSSINDFARVLGVPTAAVSLIVPRDGVTCRSNGCTFQAIEGNNDYCPAHQRSWYPLAGDRGCDLLGPAFMRFSHKGRHRQCDCTSTTCKAAGYFPGQDALYIPAKW